MALARARAEKNADRVIQGFKVAAKEGIEAKMSYVRENLAKNPDLVFHLSSLLKNDAADGRQYPELGLGYSGRRST